VKIAMCRIFIFSERSFATTTPFASFLDVTVSASTEIKSAGRNMDMAKMSIADLAMTAQCAEGETPHGHHWQ
jgi:hypothetical protein